MLTHVGIDAINAIGVAKRLDSQEHVQHPGATSHPSAQRRRAKIS